MLLSILSLGMFLSTRGVMCVLLSGKSEMSVFYTVFFVKVTWCHSIDPINARGKNAQEVVYIFKQHHPMSNSINIGVLRNSKNMATMLSAGKLLMQDKQNLPQMSPAMDANPPT